MGIISLRDKEYPQLLKKIKTSPKKLYCKGNLDPEIFDNCLAVVGSRRMTNYGRRAVERLVTKVAAAGITIVSGFMYGVDATAHRAALNAGGRTIAVMPCGINLIHPAYQDELYNDILENKGLVISEFEGDFQPTLWSYPKRNRIVAGLSKAVLVVEAASRSGSLITANLAKEYERKIFAVPGPITSEVSEGTAQLLRDGAGLAASSADILKYYAKNGFSLPFNPKTSKNSKKSGDKFLSGLGKSEKRIIEELRRESLDIDALARTLGTPASELGTALSIMQLNGFVSQEGNKYCLK